MQVISTNYKTIQPTWQICWANIRHWGMPSLCLGRYSLRLPRGRYSIISCTTCPPVSGQNSIFIVLFLLLFKGKRDLLHIMGLKKQWCSACCVLKAQNIDKMEAVLHLVKIFIIYRGKAETKNQFLESSTEQGKTWKLSKHSFPNADNVC